MGERGSLTLEAAIIMPVVFLFIFGVIQGALWYHARNVALGAAQEGARTAAAEQASVDEGRQAALDYINVAGGDDVLQGSAVIPGGGIGTEISMTVSGRPPSVIPGVPGPPVTQTAAFPVERFVPGG